MHLSYVTLHLCGPESRSDDGATVGNLHPDTTCEDICNTIRGGILESIKLIPEKHICFIHFVMPESAFALYQLISQNGLIVRNRRLKVGWGKNTGPCPPGIQAIVNNGGSRNVYIGNVSLGAKR